MSQNLILASTSPFRRELLARLGLPFDVANPQTDETALPGETPEQIAMRLSEAKARAVVETHPDALIIGSDQVATVDGKIYGKPGTHQRAVEQLRALSGKTVNFFTGLCLLNSAKSEGLGIALLSSMRGDDPNALVGLPLIALCDMLRTQGVAVL